MPNPMIVRSDIQIDAPASKVWQVLTHPEETKKYMFGCAALSDWKPGSTLDWKGVFNGVEITAVKGKIVDIQPGKFLAYTTIDPNNPAMPDLPENYLTVTYSLAEKNGHTHLEVTQGDYATVADGDNRYADTVKGGGWTPILVQVKEIAEG